MNDRHRRILEAVQQAGQLSVLQLAELTGTSDMTVRRDLEQLADQGMLERYRGGARSLVLRGEEPPFAVRAQEGLDAKRRIAEAVAGMIADGEAVVLDSGTTCLEVARLLTPRRLTVMPLSMHSCANSALSDKKPNPGCSASAPVFWQAEISAFIFR